MEVVKRTFYVTSTNAVPGGIRVVTDRTSIPPHLPSEFWGRSRLEALEFQQKYKMIQVKRTQDQLDALLSDSKKLNQLLEEEHANK